MFQFLNNISPTELIIIALILLLLFGAGVMKRVAKTSGETVKEMKKIKKEFTQTVLDDDNSSKS